MERIELKNNDFPANLEEGTLEKMLVSNFKSPELCYVALAKRKLGKRLNKRWSKLGNNVVCAVTNAFKYVELLSKTTSKERSRKAVWSKVLKSLTERYPGSQLPEKLISALSSHFDSLPLSYAQAGFDMEDVFYHLRLLEEITHDAHCQPVVVVQDHACETGRCSSASDHSLSSLCTSGSSDDGHSRPMEAFKMVFACKAVASRPALIWALESAGVSVKQLQLFEKKCVMLGVAVIQCNRELISETERFPAIIIAAIGKSKAAKLKLGINNCEALTLPDPLSDITSLYHSRSTRSGLGEDKDTFPKLSLDFSIDQINRAFGFSSPESLRVIIRDRQTNGCEGNVLQQCLLDSNKLLIGERIAVGSSGTVCKASYEGKVVAVKTLRGCEGVEFRHDVVALFSCQRKNVVTVHGICTDPQNGMCLVMEYLEGGSLAHVLQKGGKMSPQDAIRIAKDIVEGIVFLHERGIVHRDLKSSGILLDANMGAVIGDLGILDHQNTYQDFRGHRWMAPEVLGSDPDSLVITFMSNIYSFGIILWEMLTGQIPDESYSPVQAHVAAYGLRLTIPSDCPIQLRHLLEWCWSTCHLDRPSLSKVLEMLEAAAADATELLL